MGGPLQELEERDGMKTLKFCNSPKLFNDSLWGVKTLGWKDRERWLGRKGDGLKVEEEFLTNNSLRIEEDSPTIINYLLPSLGFLGILCDVASSALNSIQFTPWSFKEGFHASVLSEVVIRICWNMKECRWVSLYYSRALLTLSVCCFQKFWANLSLCVWFRNLVSFDWGMRGIPLCTYWEGMTESNFRIFTNSNYTDILFETLSFHETWALN